MCRGRRNAGVWLARNLAGIILLVAGRLDGFGAATGAAAPNPHHPSSEFFAEPKVHALAIEIAETNLAALRGNDRQYVPVRVREGKATYSGVGLHLKGAAGSRRGLDDRPALTLNFDKFHPGQKFHGIDKLHLNNSVQDGSYMTEYLCGELFRAAGVPATRVSYAQVSLNGRDLGLYVLKEGFDRAFLSHYFSNRDGNLYDGGFLREITDGLERTSGTGPDTRADLRRLAAAAMEPDADKRFARLDAVLDVERFLSFVAMEVMTWHWDGYAMKRNNYRIYHDPTSDRMVFLPHGMDQMFWDTGGSIQPPMEGLVARALLDTPEGKRRYRERLATLLTNVFRIEVLTNRIAELHRRLRPALASISEPEAQSHARSVNYLRSQILERNQKLQHLVQQSPVRPLRFDSNGIARLIHWDTQDPTGGAQFEKVSESNRVNSLYIRITYGDNPRARPSWRSSVMLPPGRYVFEGRVRTKAVEPAKEKDTKGEGAGLRVAGSRSVRPNAALGTTPWTKVEYPFEVGPDTEEVAFVCELRARAGEAWFDLESLKVRKVVVSP